MAQGVDTGKRQKRPEPHDTTDRQSDTPSHCFGCTLVSWSPGSLASKKKGQLPEVGERLRRDKLTMESACEKIPSRPGSLRACYAHVISDLL